MIGNFVVVTTDSSRRGVFAGVLIRHDEDKAIVDLERCRMAVYWPEETKGVMGLAIDGPGKGSRISKAVKKIHLNGVTSVIDATDAAQKAWELEIWD